MLVPSRFLKDHRNHRCKLIAGCRRRIWPKRPTKLYRYRPARSAKTGANVSILSLGGMFNIASNQMLMKQAMKWGVTYWDTADCYQRGSENGIGKYFKKYPEDRNRVFLVTKSDARTPKGMTKLLDRSLEKMKTNYIDLYFVHGIDSIDELDESTKTWAEKAKATGKIRFFGFSTHSNMEECLQEAAGLGWIDGIMMTYNYRLMHKDRMKRAVDACVEAGIGLTAMKTQGGGQVKTNTETELKLAGRFMQKGFTDAQAKLMAVWQNPNICQYLLADAEHDHSDVQRRRRHGQDATLFQ